MLIDYHFFTVNSLFSQLALSATSSICIFSLWDTVHKLFPAETLEPVKTGYLKKLLKRILKI